MPFNQITSIQLGKGVFSSTIKLRAYGYQEDIEGIPKDKAEKIVEYIKNAVKDTPVTHSAVLRFSAAIFIIVSG